MGLGFRAYTVDFWRHFRFSYILRSLFLVIGLSLRASDRGCLQLPPWFFRKNRKHAFKFFKKSICNQTHTHNNTHTHNTQKEQHTWFLPLTGDACSSTGLHWGITLDNCSTGEIFGNSIKPDTSHDNYWLQLGSKVLEFSWLDFPLPGDFDFEFSWLSVAQQRYDTWVFLARYRTTEHMTLGFSWPGIAQQNTWHSGFPGPVLLSNKMWYSGFPGPIPYNKRQKRNVTVFLGSS